MKTKNELHIGNKNTTAAMKKLKQIFRNFKIERKP